MCEQAHSVCLSVFSHNLLSLCECLCVVHCYGIHGQLWLHFTRGMSDCVDAYCSETCHFAVTVDTYLHEKSYIWLFIALSKSPEADMAKTNPVIFASVFSQWIFVGLISYLSKKCTCVWRTQNYNPGVCLKITWKISQHIVLRHNFRMLMQCKHCRASQCSTFTNKQN